MQIKQWIPAILGIGILGAVNTISVDAFRDGRLNARQYFMKFQYLFN